MAQNRYGSKADVQPDRYGGKPFPPGRGPLKGGSAPAQGHTCAKCGKSVSTSLALAGHMRSHK